MKAHALWDLRIFGLFFGLCALFFLGYSIHGSLPGNHDSWANLAMFEILRADLLSLFGGQSPDFGYPGANARLNYGLDYFSGIFYLMIQFILRDEVWSYNCFIALLLSLNGFAWYGLMRSRKTRKIASLVSALLFMFNPFVLGNLDNPNFLAFFPGIFALGLLRLVKQGNTGYATFVFLGYGLQFLLNPYGAVLIALWTLTEIDPGFISILSRRPLAFWAVRLLPVLSIVLVYASYYLNQPEGLYNPVLSLGKRPNVLDIQDWWTSLPGTLLDYPKYYPRNQFLILDYLKVAFPGFGLLFFGLTGILISRKDRFKLLFLFLFGLFFSSVLLEITLSTLGKNPMDFFLFKTFRIPFRFYLLCIFAGCAGVALLIHQAEHKRYWAFLILILQFFSVPVFRTYYNSREVLHISRQAAVEISRFPSPVLHLPSSLFTEKGDKNEYRYMYINALNRQTMYNGNFAFFTPERMQTDSLLKKGLVVFLKTNKPGVIVLHKWIEEPTTEYKHALILQNWKCSFRNSEIEIYQPSGSTVN